MRSALAYRPELEQRAGAGCGGGSQGRGSKPEAWGAAAEGQSQGLQDKTTPHRGQGSGCRAAEGSLGRGPRGDRQLAPACPCRGGGGPEHRSQGLCRQRPHGQPLLPGKGSRRRPLKPTWRPPALLPCCSVPHIPAGPSLLPRGSAPKMKVKVTQSSLTLCDPVDYTVHGILQAGILEWAAFPFSRGSPEPRSPALRVESLPAELPGGKNCPPNQGEFPPEELGRARSCRVLRGRLRAGPGRSLLAAPTRTCLLQQCWFPHPKPCSRRRPSWGRVSPSRSLHF